MKIRILELLKQSGDFLSGEQLSHQFGVSRAAIWKTIKSLQQDGYPIEAVTNRGYRLSSSADVLSVAEIQDCLQQRDALKLIAQISFEKSVDSTNLFARRAAEKGAPDGSLFVSERQTAGRGRRGRTWDSDHRQGLWFSLLLRPQGSPAEMSLVTLFTGLCVAQALQQTMGVAAGIKWPNDVVAISSKRKLGGILTEIIIEENQINAVIIGIGINVNTVDFPAELEASATSLYLESGRTFRRTDILAAVLEVFASRYASFLDSDRWLPDYRNLCLTLGRQVQVIEANGHVLVGQAVDLDPAGELIIQDQDGKCRTIRSGEVSVRGLLGYV